ncbi:MAG: protein kinase [Deltaproteobacteria bacterium]|nr:protein kinase [Deltaproteobacteria bacterium]
MAADPDDDEFARTATAPDTQASPKEALPPLGDKLGRYKLERPLGIGGMGVVHCAFDPDLERRVALKVLRKVDRSDEARLRLLREARALAKITHPNVVNVHEVGTADGRDYVAMELIDGDSLDAWLKAQPRSTADIIAAFISAGRGLAAAHAAGLVHRDFKPHNVLRDQHGRIVVTDFGLARGVEKDGQDISFDTTLPPGTAADELTKTGSLLGTPAYMAPEQWDHGPVGPAADQFGFCVALWEALAGERPFKGDTFEDLKHEIQRGPDELDVSKLPRRLRKPLRRGLDPDPAKRYPSMDALLAALTRAERRPGVAVVIGSGAIVAAATLYLALSNRSTGPDCRAPVIDPGFWSANRAAELARADQGPAAAAIQADFDRWKGARARACSANVADREARLGCLDGVLARLSLATQATLATKVPRVETAQILVDPAVCETPRPPRLMPATSPEMVGLATHVLESGLTRDLFDGAAADALIAKTSEPCSSAVAHLLAVSARENGLDRDHELDEADRLAQRCGDDRLIADVAIGEAVEVMSETDSLTNEQTGKLKRAQALTDVVAQRDLQSDLDEVRATMASRADDDGEAIARETAAIAGYETRGRVRAQIAAGLRLIAFQELRGHPEDLAAVPALLAQYRALAVKHLGEHDEAVRNIDLTIAQEDFSRGDVRGAHAKLEHLIEPMPLPHAQKITGRVVDEQGQPVAGALVTAGSRLVGDAVSAAMPSDIARSATTKADGTFELPEAPERGAIVAELAGKRSVAQKLANNLTLQLQPTTHIEGKVDLHGVPGETVGLSAHSTAQGVTVPYAVTAPILADGSFVLDGLPRGKISISIGRASAATFLLAGTEVDATGDSVRGVQISLGGGARVIHVIVRSTVASRVPSAEVFVLPGHVASASLLSMVELLKTSNVRSARQLEGESAPKPVLAQMKAGDMYATVRDVPDGAASACALGLPDRSDPTMKHIDEHLDRIEVKCVDIPKDAEVVVVEVPPFPRID